YKIFILFIYSNMNPALEINDESLLKYKKAGQISAKVLNKIINQIKVNINIRDLCELGNNMILEETKNYEKSGIAFPVCISVNNCAGFNTNDYILKDKDLVQIELGVHIDCYP